jgi:hypothetical protein
MTPVSPGSATPKRARSVLTGALSQTTGGRPAVPEVRGQFSLPTGYGGKRPRSFGALRLNNREAALSLG